MRNIVLATAMTFGLMSSALAHVHSHPHTHHAVVPTPPKRPVATVPQAGVVVTAPAGSEVDVTVDGPDRGGKFLGIF